MKEPTCAEEEFGPLDHDCPNQQQYPVEQCSHPACQHAPKEIDKLLEALKERSEMERAAKEAAEDCRIKYGRDFTQAVDMFKRGAEWQSQHCVTDCVKEADTKAQEERAKEVQDACARTTKSFFSKQLPPAPEEWAKVRDEQYSHFEQSGSVFQKTVGTGYLLGFDAALDLIARPLLKRCEEIEARLAEANANLEWEKQQASRLHNERVEWHQKYVDENTKHAHDRAAMREALEALENTPSEVGVTDFGIQQNLKRANLTALAKLKKRLKP